MINVGIFDENTVFLDTFYDYISTLPNVTCVIRAQDSERFFRYFKYESQLTVDILFLDAGLNTDQGIEIIQRIRRRLPLTEIIIYTVNEDADVLFKALCMGATGYILKETPLSELSVFIQIIKEGGAVVAPRMAKKLVEYFAPPKSHSESLFNPRELQILKLLADGLTYKQVAKKVNLSVDTIRFYVKRIYKILNIKSKNELMKLAYNKQLMI
ncbi:response regulator transcription factor [Runella aurantiaca]|uniref:DNA-binding response regulator n=1 Tax=Runella aurantiaca TaxID=2282308 RepID=A0A369I8H9_9BACT|nr:response regulator transcription factor [Runella aurantiaca]RDB06059.1 DNA-binding response regulator [Runella aurantiaca]